jgi:TRAF3-interacting protein 1
MRDLATLIPVTQELVVAIITKPRMTEKLLTRPPFRFLHDVLMQINSSTHFIDGLYSGDELSSTCIIEKEAEISFLTKIITFIENCTNGQVPCKALKIVAGLEPEGTNILLQLVARTASNPNINYREAIRKTLGLEEEGAGQKETKQDDSPPADKKKIPVQSQEKQQESKVHINYNNH